MGNVVYNACYGGFGLSRAATERLAAMGVASAKEHLADPEAVRYGYYARDVPRHDPRLVRVVEEMGEAASAQSAKLRIADLGEGAHAYKIVDSDGKEPGRPDEGLGRRRPLGSGAADARDGGSEVMKPTMTADDLLAAGFRKFSAGPLYPERSALYQKTVYTADGARLFSLNVYAMDWPERMPEAARERYQWSIGAQLYRNDLTMDLGLRHEPGMTPGEIEAFYRDAHAALGCTRDPHND